MENQIMQLQNPKFHHIQNPATHPHSVLIEDDVDRSPLNISPSYT